MNKKNVSMELETVKLEARRFNKENALAFAADLYSVKNGVIHYRPLCVGRLARANGEVTCCLLGEMYEYFVGKPLYTEIRQHTKSVKVLVREPTIVAELVKTADTKKPELLGLFLHGLTGVNDGYILDADAPDDEEQYIYRAERCAKAVRDIAHRFFK